ncbi:MAG: hypothetical protein QOI06_204 [Nocardioidaceae bacterium]|nr:hypothetical protein [Nocardioidaceae bacterium]
MRARRRVHSAFVAGSAAVVMTAASLFAGAPAQSAPSITVTPWLTGLNAPRGVAFDGAGHFYVSESGLAGSGDHGLTHTGQVSRYELGSTTPVWTTQFSSLYAHEAPPPAPADVLGPEGLAVLRQGCVGPPPHSAGDCKLRMIQSESNKGTGITNPQIGRLFELNRRTGASTTVSDVGNRQWRWTKNHPNVAEPLPDSNPYGVLITRMHGVVRTFVADAGANTISEIMPGSGRTRVVALIPNDTPKHDSTPTCIAKGPDGMLYVATLDLVVNNFGNSPGHSNVWRVDPNASYPTKPTIWASGLTTVTACTFDSSGHFWGTEMFAPNSAGPPGDLVRIPFSHPTHVSHLGLGDIPLPGGITQGPDGAMYVSINSAAPGPAGQVVKVVVN